MLQDVNFLVATALEQMKRVDVYSDSFSVFTAMVEEDLQEQGVDNSYGLLEFYINLALLANYGGVSIIDTKGSDFKLGFSEFEGLLSQVSKFQGAEGLEVNLKTQLKVSNLRDVSLDAVEDDLLEKYLAEDATLVLKALGQGIEQSKVDEDLKDALSEQSIHSDESLVEKLKKSSKLSSIVKNVVEDILAVYDSSLATGYELEKPISMIIGEPQLPTLTVGKDYKPYPMRSTASFFLGSAIRSVMAAVDISYSRQFDLELIHNSQKPIYFPKKIAEFALGYRVSLSESEDKYSQIGKFVWNNSSKTGHWKADYAQRKEIVKCLTDYAWEYAVVTIQQQGLSDHAWVADPTLVMTPDMAQLFTNSFRKFRDSACTFSVLKTQTGDIEQWASAEWSIVAPASALVGHPLTPGSDLHIQVFSESGELEPPRVKDVKGISIRDYRHIANAKVAESEPLFAYRALQAMQERGESVSPENLIVGKGLNGKLLTSKRFQESDLSMWKNLIHVTSSGSRSGKGVQISAQVTPSIAVGRPIFPQDRKPDTAVPFYEMAGGSDENGTPYGYFIQGGEFSKGNIASENPNTANELDWDNNPKIMGRLQKLVPSWWGISTYKGIWGDMAYFRSMLLTLGILCLRAETRSSDPALYEQLGGDQGVVILYDEITNFTEQFMQKYMNSSNWFSKDVWSKKKSNNLRMAFRSLETVKEGSKAEFEAQDIIEEAKKGKFQFNVYMRDLINNYNETMDALSAKEKAGFNQQESYFSDVYIVGQSLQITTADKPRITFTNTGEVAAFGPKDAHLLSFLYNFQSDFVFGFNETSGAAHQAWRSQPGSDAERLLTSTARRFGYLSGVTYEDVRDGKRDMLHKSESKETAGQGGTVYFKPYLLLTSDNGTPVEQLEKALGSSLNAVKSNNSKIDSNGQVVVDSDGVPVWNPAIGLPEYVKRMSGRSDNLGQSFVRAREIAELVIKRMGYQGDYLDFLLDLRPEWNFSASDVVNAFTNPAKFAKAERMSSWNEYTAIMEGRDPNSETTATGSSSDFANLEFENEGADTDNWSSEEPQQGSWSTEDSTQAGYPTDPSQFEATETFEEPTQPEAVYEEERVYENPQNWQPKAGTIPVSQEGIERLALALGIAPALLMSTYMGENPNATADYTSYEEFNTAPARETVNPVNMTFGDLHNVTESVTLSGLKDLMSFITSDVLEQFGGLEGIENLSVKGGMLTVNGIVYKPSFPNIDVRGLPVDKRVSLQNKQYADLFDFGELARMSNLTFLSFDSSSFLLTKVLRPLGLSESDSVFRIFDIVRTLQELTIGSSTFNRRDGLNRVIERESVFKSSRRRAQVLERTDEVGRNFRKARWDSTKRYWSTETGWKRFTGVSSNLVGVGLGATTQVGAKTIRQTNNLIKSAGRLFSVIAKDIGEEFKK